MNDDRPPNFLAIGASGKEGLHDIIGLLQALPRPIFAILMVVLHRPSDSVSYLKDVLARHCPMPVIVAQEAESMTPGVCYIGEPDGHLTLVDRHIAHLVPGADNRLRNQIIDTLFDSLANHTPGRTIGVILSGSLDDGSRGLAAIHKSHGLTMVLDPGIKPRGMQQNAIDYDGPIGLIGSRKDLAEAIGKVLAETPSRLRP